MKSTKLFIATLALGAVAASSQAAFFYLTTSGVAASSHLPWGDNGQLFRVLTPISVSELGLRDSGTPGLNPSTTATIGLYRAYDLDKPTYYFGPVIVSASIVGNNGTPDAYNAGYTYRSVADTVLSPGIYGLIASQVTLGSGDLYGHTWDGGTLPTYINNSAVTGVGVGDVVGGLLLPTPTLSEKRNDLVNLKFTPVPEPETYAMIAGVGLVAFGLWRRRQ